MFPKVAGKFPTKIGAAYDNSYIFYKTFYSDDETFKWPFFYFNGRYIKIHGARPSRSPYFFT